MVHALKFDRARLLARLQEPLGDTAEFERFLERRMNHEPLAYITGVWEFFSHSFEVCAPVLVPRPETEHLAEAVIGFVGNNPARILEIGTGTGCVAVTVACETGDAAITATDIRPTNVELARRNAQRHEIESKIQFLVGDLFEPVHNVAPFDVICWNPPYVAESEWEDLPEVITRHEDPAALLSGPAGLDAITRLVAEAGAHLRSGGLLAFEIAMGQDTQVRDLLEQHGYRDVDVRPDLARIPRVAVGLRP